GRVIDEHHDSAIGVLHERRSEDRLPDDPFLLAVRGDQDGDARSGAIIDPLELLSRLRHMGLPALQKPTREEMINELPIEKENGSKQKDGDFEPLPRRRELATCKNLDIIAQYSQN